ncbi:hypothetical protein Taro_015037 [Colocasia esculenta]|uniref:Uncharacterized protein n=1 Tax=Colocasia esculenta TaxID=4460 RepID=A0A843UGI3_COLES|nr:hypothetical protein [Colocasia esculenta]
MVAREQWNDHNELIFLPRSSAATCANRLLEADQKNNPVAKEGKIGPQSKALSLLCQSQAWTL